MHTLAFHPEEERVLFGDNLSTNSNMDDSDMELGNALFGNSRGEVQVDRNIGYEEEIERLTEALEVKTLQEITEWENDTFYVSNYSPRSSADDPNFIHKPSGLELQWYKYPLRDSYFNRDCTLKEFRQIIDDCVESVEDNPPSLDELWSS